jgi:hypothetical protein
VSSTASNAEPTDNAPISFYDTSTLRTLTMLEAMQQGRLGDDVMPQPSAGNRGVLPQS